MTSHLPSSESSSDSLAFSFFAAVLGDGEPYMAGVALATGTRRHSRFAAREPGVILVVLSFLGVDIVAPGLGFAAGTFLGDIPDKTIEADDGS